MPSTPKTMASSFVNRLDEQALKLVETNEKLPEGKLVVDLSQAFPSSAAASTFLPESSTQDHGVSTFESAVGESARDDVSEGLYTAERDRLKVEEQAISAENDRLKQQKELLAKIQAANDAQNQEYKLQIEEEKRRKQLEIKKAESKKHLARPGQRERAESDTPKIPDARKAEKEINRKQIQLSQTGSNFNEVMKAQSVENQNLQRILDTPRTQKACREMGILPQELQIKRPAEFAQVGDNPAKIKVRFNHFEQKRQEKLKLVLEARSRIIASEFESLGNDQQGGFYSLQLMEDLLDKEAKRLEKTLRHEVRAHAAIEKENEVQLQREKMIKDKIQYREQQKRKVAEERMVEAKKRGANNKPPNKSVPGINSY